MINAGFNPLSVMADKTGKSIATLKEEMSKGAITSEMVQQAFIDATSAGGKFYQMSERASKTINGQISMMQDALDAMFNSLGEQSEGAILGAIETTTSLIENYETVGKVIAGLVAVYGTYKAAMIVDIALEQAHNKTLWSNIQATKAYTSAKAVLNKVMLANPYALAAAAIAAVVAGVWALSDETSRLHNAEERYNEEKQKTIDAEKKHADEISRLVDMANNEELSTENRREALVKLEQQYPAIFAKYDTEYEKLKNIRDIKQEIDTLDSKSSITNVENEAKDLENRIAALEAKGKAKYNTVTTQYGSISTQVGGRTVQDEADLKIYQKRLSEITEEKQKKSANIYLSNLTGISNDELKKQIIERKQLLAQMELHGTAKGKIKSGGATGTFSKTEIQGQLQILESEKTEREKDIKSAKEWVAEKKDAYDKALKAYNDYVSGNKGKIREDKFAEESKRLKTEAEKAKKEYEKYKPLSTKAAEKEADKKQKAEQKASDELLALKRQTQQSEIDIMQDGLDKKIAQINLDYDKQQDAIAKRKRELTAKNKEQGISGLTAEQTAAIEAERKASEAVRDKQMADARNSDLQYMRDYLKEYGTFQQQKLAIAEEYNERIANSANEWERKSLAEQRDAAVRQVDINAIKRQIDWGGVFGDFSSMFRSQLQPTIDKLQAIAGSDGFRASPLEEQKVLYDLISKLEQSATVWDSDIFVRISDDLVRHQQTMSQLYTEQERNQVILNELEKAKSRLASAQSSGDDNAVMQAQVSVDSWSAALQNSNEAIRSLESSAQETSASLSELSTKAVTQFQQLESGLRGLSSGSLQGVGQGIMQLDRTFNSDKITSTVGNALAGGVTKLFGKNSEATKKLTEALGETGMAGEIISAGLGILDILRDGVDNLVTSLLDTVLGGVNGLLDSLLSKDTYINIGKSLRDNIGNILNSATFGGFKSLFSSSNAKEVNETTERLTNANDRLRESVDKLKDEMSKSGGWRAISAATQAEADQRKINQQTMEILKAQMGYTGAHHSNAYYWGLGQGDYASLNKTLADYARKNPNADTATNAVGSLEDIYKLTPEQMDYIRTYNIEMWERMITQGKYDKSGYWEQYADLAGELESITESLRETLTQTSFDSLRSSFVDSLMDMEKDASDFADDFSQMMMKAMLNSRIDDLLGDELEQFYKQWAEMAKSDGGLDSNEIKQLQEWWQRLTEAGIAARDEIASITGYDTSSFSQKPSVGGYQSMGEDTGQEMNGRLTAIQEGVYQIRDLDIERNELLRGLGGASLENVPVTQISTEALQSLSAQMAEQYTVHTDTRRILAESYLELQQIRENTGAIVKPIKRMNEQLSTISDNIKNKL